MVVIAGIFFSAPSLTLGDTFASFPRCFDHDDETYQYLFFQAKHWQRANPIRAQSASGVSDGSWLI